MLQKVILLNTAKNKVAILDLGSNTAKLLLQFGAEPLVWGVQAHEARLHSILQAEREHAVVLFPGPGAVEAHTLAKGSPGRTELPRIVVVLDGGWKEARKINQAIDERIQGRRGGRG